jgi:DNA-binding SARP family transcriptional activator/Flp pilus assembly protein TadD
MLGGFELTAGDTTVNPLPRQVASLLAYLLVHRNRPQTRDLLAGRFWSDQADDRARKRLSNALWKIRAAFRDAGIDELLQTTSTTVQISPDWRVEVDFESFERRLDDISSELRQRVSRIALAERLAEIVDNYPGDFLAGYYDDWIESERTRIRDRCLDALWQLIKLYKGRSDYTTAIRYARELVTHDPFMEEAHREVMRLCALLGQTAAAERQYELCRRVLEDELGVEPSWETTELIERIRSEGSTAAAPLAVMDATTGPIIGRDRERAILLNRVDDLIGGNGGVALIEGEPGIGKSRLVEDLVDSAVWRGARVLTAGHTELSAMEPYQAIREALTPATTGLRGEHLAEVTEPIWLQQASSLFEDLRPYVVDAGARQPLRPDEEPARMSEALARIILAQGGLGPTLIVFEDVHWSDGDSMQVFANLGQRLARSGVLVCLSYRRFQAEQSQAVWPVISRLETLTSTSRVVVSPLNQAEIRELVTAKLGPGGIPNRILERLVDDSGGNPLFVMEALRDPEALLTADRADDSSDVLIDRYPATIARALAQRLASLDDDVRRIMSALAVLAEPCSVKHAADITGLDRRRALAALNDAVSRGFLVELGSGACQFSHDQTRRAVHQSIDREEILSWHDQIFQALVASPEAQPHQLAYHADRAQLWDDAAHWHLVAANDAKEINAFGVAADHYSRADEAAETAGRTLVERVGDLLDYEAVLDVLGRRTDQQMLLKRLHELDLSPADRLELVDREAWLMANTDRPDEAAQLALRWVPKAREAGQSTHRLLTVVGVARYRGGDLGGAVGSLRDALEAMPDDAGRVTIDNQLGRALIDMAETEEGDRLVARALAKAEELDDVRSQVEAFSYQSISAFRRGDYEEAVARGRRTLELSRDIGYRYGEAGSLVNLASIYTAQGRGGLALPMFDQAAEVFGSVGHGRGEAFVKMNLAELHHRLLGQHEEAAALANSAAVYFRGVGDRRMEIMSLCKLCSTDWRSGRRRLAKRRLKHLIEDSTAIENHECQIETRRIAADFAVESEDYHAAINEIDVALDLIERHSVGYVMAHALALRAVASIQLGDTAGAVRDVERAIPLNRAEAEFAFVTAWRCGRVLKAVGRETDAIGQFELAYELLESNLDGIPDDKRAAAWASTEFAAIIEDYEKLKARFMDVVLPLADAPLGRPLHADEFTSVRWSLSLPEDWETTSVSERRRNRVLRLTEQAAEAGAVARVSDLADAIGVSERTVKRDLAELRKLGRKPKTRRSS